MFKDIEKKSSNMKFEFLICRFFVIFANYSVICNVDFFSLFPDFFVFPLFPMDQINFIIYFH